MSSQKELGAHAEIVVVAHLKQRGFTIVAQNYRRFFGEIDIIATHQKTVAFIEVKARHNPLFDMTELISYTKQMKIIRTAKQYCSEKGIIDMICRFDVALVHYDAHNQPHVTIIENAFTESFQ